MNIGIGGLCKNRRFFPIRFIQIDLLRILFENSGKAKALPLLLPCS